MTVHIPEQGDVTVVSTLKVSSVHGYWEVYDEDMNLTDKGYACADTDTIHGCIVATVQDSVADSELLRSAVIEFELAYTAPNPDGGDDTFTSEGFGYYELANNTQGETEVTVCGAFLGINGSPFDRGPLVPGSYSTYITASIHFAFDIFLTLKWTMGNTVDVILCPHEPPSLNTIPQPPSPKAGDLIYDTAQLTGGEHPTGSITFKLWEDEAETILHYTEVVGVDGDGTYRTANVPTPLDVPFPAGLHWHWKAHFSGDGFEVDSGSEPVIILPDNGSPGGSDEFSFSEVATITGDDHPDLSPGVARFQAEDLGQLWFTRTKDDVNTEIAAEDRFPVGPSIKNHLAIGGQNYIIEIKDGSTGAHVYDIVEPVDGLLRPMKNIMGVCYNYKNSDLYAALTPDPTIPFTPHDVDWFQDDTGILAAVVTGGGVLHFRKYDYSGELITDWLPEVEDGWWKQHVKISISCDSKVVFYTFQGTTMKRFNLETGTQLSDYLRLVNYSGYRFGDLEVMGGSGDATSLVVTMTRTGQGPHEGVAIASGRYVWDDRDNPVDTIYKAEKRRLGDLGLELAVATNDGDRILALGCNFSPCQVSFPIMVTLVGAS